MNTPAASPSRSLPFTLAVFGGVAAFLLVVSIATVVTFILPEFYASSTRVKLEPRLGFGLGTNSPSPNSGAYDPNLIRTELEILRSEVVLGKVIEDLGLNTHWGRRFLGDEALKTAESLMLLKGRLDLRPVRNTSLIEIRMYSENPNEAATIANAVTAAYAAHAASNSTALRVEVVDVAHPGVRPVRPNRPLNISLGIVIGLVVGLGCGLFTYWLVRVFQRRKAVDSQAG